MATATAQQITDQAFDKIGLTTPTAEDSSDALDNLNSMLSSWSAEGIIVPFRTRESFSLVAGQNSRTIGSGANFDTTRPLEIISMYIRDSSDIDHYLFPISNNQYSEIASKLSSQRPTHYYYDPQFANGTIYFNSKPDTVETVYIISDKSIPELALLTTTVSLPDYYKEALVYNLAIRLAAGKNITLPNTVISIAQRSWSTIENMVAKDKIMRPAKMDNMLLINNNSYNINTGA